MCNKNNSAKTKKNKSLLIDSLKKRYKIPGSKNVNSTVNKSTLEFYGKDTFWSNPSKEIDLFKISANTVFTDRDTIKYLGEKINYNFESWNTKK